MFLLIGKETLNISFVVQKKTLKKLFGCFVIFLSKIFFKALKYSRITNGLGLTHKQSCFIQDKLLKNLIAFRLDKIFFRFLAFFGFLIISPNFC